MFRSILVGFCQQYATVAGLPTLTHEVSSLKDEFIYRSIC